MSGRRGKGSADTMPDSNHPPFDQRAAVEQLIEMIRASAVAETRLCEAIRELTAKQAGMEARLCDAVHDAAERVEAAQGQVILALDKLQEAVGTIHKDLEITSEVEERIVDLRKERLEFIRSLATSRAAMIVYCLLFYLLLEVAGVDAQKATQSVLRGIFGIDTSSVSDAPSSAPGADLPSGGAVPAP